ncbi:hypothetical protein PG984_010673 [Apiospora sp. TS-2023a]
MPALLEPEGFGRTLLVCSIVSASIAAFFVISRLCFRLLEKDLGYDDILISLGLILYVGFASTCGYSAFVGLGARNGTLESSRDPRYLAEAESLMFFIAMILYSAVLVCIKSAGIDLYAAAHPVHYGLRGCGSWKLEERTYYNGGLLVWSVWECGSD